MNIILFFPDHLPLNSLEYMKWNLGILMLLGIFLGRAQATLSNQGKIVGIA